MNLPAHPASVAAPRQSTVSEALQTATARLRVAGIETARLDAEVLLSAVCRTDRAGLIVNASHPIQAAEASSFWAAVARREQREPVAYIVRNWEFWSLDFEVGPGALVPRPDSELIIEVACQRTARHPPAVILDVGCGVGNLAVALATELAPTIVIGVDCSQAALWFAARNVRRHSLQDKIHLVCARYLSALEMVAPRPELLVSNPPYLSTGELGLAMPEVSRFEPPLALDGGTDGLECSRVIFDQARRILAPHGAVLMETAPHNMPPLIEIARDAGFADTAVHLDLAGRPRALWAQRGTS